MLRNTFIAGAIILTAAFPAFADGAGASAPAAPAPPAPVSPVPLLAKATTLQVTETLSGANKAGKLTPVLQMAVKVVKPAKVWIEADSLPADPTKQPAEKASVFVTDGATQYEYIGSRDEYVKTPVKPGQDIESQFGLSDAASIPVFLESVPFSTFAKTGSDTEGDIYTYVMNSQPGHKVVQKVWVSPMTHLPTHLSLFVTQAAQTIEAQRIDFTKWSLDQPVADSQFAWAPPATAKEYVAPKLLADGVAAPDFTVQDKTGGPVKLSDYKGKVVVLDFWATWCGPCQASLPHTTAMAKKYADKGVVFLAVNVWDKKTEFDKWLPKHPEYGALTFAIDTSDTGKDIASTLFGVSGIPTQYIIDKNGKIVHSILGYDGPSSELEDAIKKAGAA